MNAGGCLSDWVVTRAVSCLSASGRHMYISDHVGVGSGMASLGSAPNCGDGMWPRHVPVTADAVRARRLQVE